VSAGNGRHRDERRDEFHEDPGEHLFAFTDGDLPFDDEDGAGVAAAGALGDAESLSRLRELLLGDTSARLRLLERDTGRADVRLARLVAALRETDGRLQRLERVDFNVGSFTSTGRDIGDEVSAIVPGISFRPTAGTVFRANYRYHWTHDFQGNDPARMAGFQVGFATYF